jgi:hypothetical protein
MSEKKDAIKDTTNVRRLKCAVIGSGQKGDPYRPAFEEQYEEKVTVNVKLKSGLLTPVEVKRRVPSFFKQGYKVIYYPCNPPYEYCIVEVNCDENLVIPKAEAELTANDYSNELTKINKSSWFRNLCYGYIPK